MKAKCYSEPLPALWLASSREGREGQDPNLQLLEFLN